MVKNNQNDEQNKESMDLKNHLNTSFDYDNIKVSEDLITRTLKAIKDSENLISTENELVDNNIKDRNLKRSWIYVTPKKIISAAAVILLFIVGINVLSNFPTGMKSSSKHDKNEAIGNIMTKPQSNGAVMDGNYEMKRESSDNSTKESELDSSRFTTPNEESITMDITSSLAFVPFSELYPINHLSVIEVKITNNDNTIIQLKNPIEVASEIYAVLDEYYFTMDVNNNNSHEDSRWDIMVEILTVEGQSYTILFGDSISVKKNEELEYTYYVIDGKEELLERIQQIVNTITD